MVLLVLLFRLISETIMGDWAFDRMAIRIYTMYEINESPPLPIETNVLLLTVCSVSALCLLILIVLYRCQFSDSPPIVAIIAMLLLNDLL